MPKSPLAYPEPARIVHEDDSLFDHLVSIIGNQGQNKNKEQEIMKKKEVNRQPKAFVSKRSWVRTCMYVPYEV